MVALLQSQPLRSPAPRRTRASSLRARAGRAQTGSATRCAGAQRARRTSREAADLAKLLARSLSAISTCGPRSEVPQGSGYHFPALVRRMLNVLRAYGAKAHLTSTVLAIRCSACLTITHTATPE